MATTPASSTHWVTLALVGIVAIVFGAAVLVWPRMTLGLLVQLFGVYALVTGLLALLAAFDAAQHQASWLALAIEGGFSAIIGLLVLVWPGASWLLIGYFIAFWAILTGIPQVVGAFGHRDWLLAASGATLVLFGLVLVGVAGLGVATVVTIIGVFAILYGGLTLTRALKLRTTPVGVR
jgi:uncharacterized membrane protein HdeD (DUF308 family)